MLEKTTIIIATISLSTMDSVLSKYMPDSTLKTILDIHGVRFGNHSSIRINNNSEIFKLTKLERDVLFCICLGVNSRKDIACLLSAVYKRVVYANTTVHDAVRRLYEKLNCNSVTQLLEFAEYKNLHLQIPQSFLPTGSFIID